jgi:hypothetical protein
MNDVELTLRDLVAVREDWMSREAKSNVSPEVSRGQETAERRIRLREPERYPKGFKGREIGHKSHDQRAAE